MDIQILISLLSLLSFCFPSEGKNDGQCNNGQGNGNGSQPCSATTTAATPKSPAATITTQSTTATSTKTSTPTNPPTSNLVPASNNDSSDEGSADSSIGGNHSLTSTITQPSTSGTVSTTTNAFTTSSATSSSTTYVSESESTTYTSPTSAAHRLTETGNKDVGVFVGVPLGILVCLCVAGVVIFMLRKRRMKRSTEKDDIIPSQVNAVYTEIDDYHGHDNPVFDKHTHMENGIPTIIGNNPASHDETTVGIYDFIHDGEEENRNVPTTGNNYFVLEELDRTADIKGNNKTENVDRNKTRSNITPASEDDTKGVYDFAQDVEDGPHRTQSTANSFFILEKVDGQSAGDKGQEITASVDSNQVEFGKEHNVYNTANHDNKDGEYDHIGQLKKPKQASEQGHYDMTFGGSQNTNEYDTTTGVRQGNNPADGMYSHIKVNIDDAYSNNKKVG